MPDADPAFDQADGTEANKKHLADSWRRYGTNFLGKRKLAACNLEADSVYTSDCLHSR